MSDRSSAAPVTPEPAKATATTSGRSANAAATDTASAAGVVGSEGISIVSLAIAVSPVSYSGIAAGRSSMRTMEPGL